VAERKGKLKEIIRVRMSFEQFDSIARAARLSDREPSTYLREVSVERAELDLEMRRLTAARAASTFSTGRFHALPPVLRPRSQAHPVGRPGA
jgi:hypothetical protein